MFELIRTYTVKNSMGFVYSINGRRAATFAKSLDSLLASLGVNDMTEQRAWIAAMANGAQVVDLPQSISRQLVVSAIEEIAALNLQGPNWTCLDAAPRNARGEADCGNWTEFYNAVNNMAYWCTRFSDDFIPVGLNEILRLA